MRLRRLWLADFRNYETAELEPASDGLTVVVGGNGEGKTNLLEAIAYLATLSSFRSSPAEALVRQGAAAAVVRAEVERAGRPGLIEAELPLSGRQRVLVNRQPLRRARDLLGAFRVTVFAPDDLALVKEGPAARRRYLDDTLLSLHPRNDGVRAEVERVLRQRAALLRQCGGRLSADAAVTLDVWDAKLAVAGEALATARAELVDALDGGVVKAYDRVAGTAAEVSLAYRRSWEGPLAAALSAARQDDVRRAMTSVGPHRDDVELVIGGLPARTHASQGEQRCLALALRLGAHDVVTEATGEAPVLLLDDVFSELDEERGDALLASLPEGQTLLTTAGHVPAGALPQRTVRVREGRIL